MSITKTYAAVLSPFIQEFRDASNEKARKTVIDIAVDAVKRSKALLEDARDLPKDLPTVRVPLFLYL
jgi:hypothetical protein